MRVSPETTRVGVIGLGVMGKPMARNLLRAGYHLVVHNRSRAPVEELVALGAVDGGSPRGVGQASDVVLTVLPDTPDVEHVVFGPEGLVEGMRPGGVLIDMSTISPEATRSFAERLRERGIEMLDAPVSGGQRGAEEGTLAIMVGGPGEVFQRCRPLFEVLGRHIVHLGPHGAGQVCKACNQIVVALTLQAVSEALVLAERAGVDPAKVREALLGGFAYSRILEVHGQRMLEGNFAPGFRVELHRKDLRVALEAGRAYGVPLPGTAITHELLGALVATGRGKLDHSALVLLVRQLAGGGGLDAGSV
ncbi:MAG: 2-hydroxy-3-oxopropionate reductase [Armatimonadota bacterium]|nr:2-hydroxy-3-oxopropionate reductase [Armatimonadota bacterium]MDR7440168.1 2-hydroxy-3-oxopropionate reductase [Armatimonadota bacterium]MDR7563834.1 2-hydroxy-3-oxopropionate reductase [Armatimonadota bacterium]MDR7567220.1 2-hydroxy-3-oxopropionate reductase [Armatimonadota bacterium]MDR7603046.1 2-hydroxy-3-oxopropionate reductase [Armatimonadota bacterium]